MDSSIHDGFSDQMMSLSEDASPAGFTLEAAVPRIASVGVAGGASTYHSAASILLAYVNLAKPRAILPHFATASAAMFLAGGSATPISVLFLTLIGGGLAAASANALNCVLDRDIDAKMSRTRSRPLPSGAIKPAQALIFSAFLAGAGITILGRFVSTTAATLATFAIAYYVLAYTLLLRRRTYLGAVICSPIGAIPPIIGWVVVTNRITVTPLLLSAIIILWTVPHFWALGLFRRDDYAKAGLRIIPERRLGLWIGASSSTLVAASLLLTPVAGLGGVYLATASLLGIALLLLSARAGKKQAALSAYRLYAFSIFYIAVLFGAMIIDRIA